MYTSAWLLWPFPDLFSSSPFCATQARVIITTDAFKNWYWSCSYNVGIGCLLNNSRKPEEGAQEQKTPRIKHFNLCGYFSYNLKEKKKKGISRYDCCLALLTTRMFQDSPVGANHLLKPGLSNSQLGCPQTIESIKAINHFWQWKP